MSHESSSGLCKFVICISQVGSGSIDIDPSQWSSDHVSISGWTPGPDFQQVSGQAGPSVFHQIHFVIACYCACQCHWNVLCLFLHSSSFRIIDTALCSDWPRAQYPQNTEVYWPLTFLTLPMQNQSHLPLKFRRNSAAAQVCSTHLESTVDIL